MGRNACAGCRPISASRRRTFFVRRFFRGPNGGALTPKLHVAIQLDGRSHVVIMSQLLAIPGAQIGPVIGDASDARDDIVAAVDLLVSGF